MFLCRRDSTHATPCIDQCVCVRAHLCPQLRHAHDVLDGKLQEAPQFQQMRKMMQASVVAVASRNQTATMQPLMLHRRHIGLLPRQSWVWVVPCLAADAAGKRDDQISLNYQVRVSCQHLTRTCT